MDNLTKRNLVKAAGYFCSHESMQRYPELYRVTDGKAIGTFVEHKFQNFLHQHFIFTQGNSAHGIDLPSVNTDIKVTSITQPQSSCPFQSARQKIFGLGYHLLLFVYEKIDDPSTQTATLRYVSCVFIEDCRTADFQLTSLIRQVLENHGNKEDLISLMLDRNLPVDDIELNNLSEEILRKKPEQGYLTISNALQWRLQYKRVVDLDEDIPGIIKVV